MFKITPKRRVLFVRRSVPVVAALFGVFSLLLANLHSPLPVYAAASNTINFQARLQTASGAIVPDGNYNVEFSIYGASSGGTKLWHEDYLNANSQGLQTINGYLSANLGSITAFSGINWDQQLWLTMNVGGTVTTGTFPTIGDGEMSPRLSLTAVPAAFSASQLATTNSNGRSTVTLQGSSSGDQNFVIQDQGAAGTYNLITKNQADVSYIQNGTSLQTSSNFNISGTGIASVLQAGTAVETPKIRPITDSTTALQIQNAAGSVNIMTVDTTHDRIGIGTTSPGSTVDIKSGGDDYSTSALNIVNSMGGALVNVRDDGQFTVGTTAASGTNATIGNSDTTGSTPDGGGDANFFVSTKVSTGSSAGALTSITIYINTIDPSPAQDKYRLAIYSDNGTTTPGTLIAQSAEGTMVAHSLNTLPVSASLAANTTYWLAFVANGGAGYSGFSYKSAGTANYYSYSYPYAAFPTSPAGGGNSAAIAVVMSGTYSQAGTGTVPALTVTAGGNVGIGTSSPLYALQVQGTTSATAYLQNGNTVCDSSNNCSSLTSSTGVTLQSGTPSAQTGSLDITGSAIAGSLQAASLDTASSGALTLGPANATSIVLGNISSGNYITFTASGGLVATGTAQHAKTISLTAEYAGAVLDASNDTGGANCSTNNNGTMTSAYDGTTTYYKWVSNATAQCYDVVVRVPLPSDFSSWASTTPISINTYTTNTSTGLINLDVKDSSNSGVSGCAYANVTPSSTSTWTAMGGSCNLSTGTYTAGTGVVTLRIRLTGGASSDVRVDGITLNYNSKF